MDAKAVVARVLGVVAAASMLACASAREQAVPPPVPPEPEEYQIQAPDLLSVRVWKSGELSVDVPVRPDGMITVPLAGDVQAAGLTTTELEELVAQALEEYIANPQVTVIVREMRSKRVYVLGGVARPGPISLMSRMYVVDALSQAGGFTTFGNKGKVVVIRRVDGGEVEYHFDYSKYIKGKAPGTNIELVSGDVVVVPD